MLNRIKKLKFSILYAILAALLYAISSPVSKVILNEIPSTMLAGILYIGAGGGMLIFSLLKNRYGFSEPINMDKEETICTVAMIVLDTLAPILLLAGLSSTTAENVSLLNNFEIVATTLIALLLFNEKVSKRLWFAIGLITLASIILSTDSTSSMNFSFGSILVLLATICWGFENNCTRVLSNKNPIDIVIIKGFGSGIGSLIISYVINERSDNIKYIIFALLLGFVSYGLSIYFYILAQRYLGAAKTSAYYAIAPFMGVILSFAMFKEIPQIKFFAALLIMAGGMYLVSKDSKSEL